MFFIACDIIGLLPVYIDLCLYGFNKDIQRKNVAYELIRSLRLLLMVRIAKSSKSIRLFFQGMRHAKVGLVLLMYTFLMTLVISGWLVYIVEIPNCTMKSDGVWYYVNNDEEPCVFQSMAEALWYSAASLTSTGYGDLIPRTYQGKVVGGLIMVTGLILFSACVSLISQALTGMYEENRIKHLLRGLKIQQQQQQSRAGKRPYKFFKKCKRGQSFLSERKTTLSRPHSIIDQKILDKDEGKDNPDKTAMDICINLSSNDIRNETSDRYSSGSWETVDEHVSPNRSGIAANDMNGTLSNLLIDKRENQPSFSFASRLSEGKKATGLQIPHEASRNELLVNTLKKQLDNHQNSSRTELLIHKLRPGTSNSLPSSMNSLKDSLKSASTSSGRALSPSAEEFVKSLNRYSFFVERLTLDLKEREKELNIMRVGLADLSKVASDLLG
ncbi:Potassium voltage-gated channel sub C member 4 [Nowakowskiella sp. JEL0407]|nr:Potassium voltage-gated channel sub C member 4 [Nowakowskiella sp. JEL0407]